MAEAPSAPKLREEVREEMRGPVMWLTIDREERRNAISAGVLSAMSNALARANQDRAVRAVVITGSGTRAFCAGADLQSGTSFKFDYAEPHQGFANLFRQARQSTVPLIARVNGACMAGGMGIMGMCDMAVASSQAVFGLPEVKLGLLPGAGGTQRLPRVVGVRKALEMCATGNPIGAKDAFECGLVDRLVAASDRPQPPSANIRTASPASAKKSESSGYATCSDGIAPKTSATERVNVVCSGCHVVSDGHGDGNRAGLGEHLERAP